SPAVVGELHADLAFPGRNWLLGLGGEQMKSEHVVGELRLAIFGVDTPSSEAPTLGDDHAFRAGVWDIDLRGHRERLVLDADDAVLGEAAHSLKEHLRVTAN